MSQELVVADYHDFFSDHQGQPVVWKSRVSYGEGDEDVATCWHARHPGDCKGNSKGSMLLGPKPPAAGHYVEEHEDGHLTVRPNPPAEPGNSNSILCPICGWHGYIDHGRWYTV